MDSLWTWTRPSINTMTSAHTPAPCWTLTSDQRFSLPKLIHKQLIEAMGMISNIFIKALTSGEMFLDWNVFKKKKETDQVLWCRWSVSPGSPCPFTVMTLLPRGVCRDFHSVVFQ